MRRAFYVIVFFLTSVSFAQLDALDDIPKNTKREVLIQKPEFFVMDWKKGTSLTQKNTPMYILVDSLGRQEVSLLINEKNEPFLYSSEITTPVCADGECRLMHISLYWTLLGGYAGFDRYPNLPLTKHDHDEFLKEDYQKLHRLLMDKHSVLGRRTINALVEKPKQTDMEGVDAVSGATVAAVKESVVSGALYSCYITWNLVYGEIRHQLKKHTLSLLNDGIVVQMLYNSNVDYQIFALKRFNEKQYEQHNLRIAEIFEIGIPLIRTFIIKNLPDSFWNTSELQQQFWKSFSILDVNSRSLLFEHLEMAPESTIKEISKKLRILTKNQLKAYLNCVEKRKVDQSIMANLIVFSNSPSENYNYLVEEFLEQYEN
ncbi:MAG: hypothetical protein WBM53_13775 [Maribacter sp.]